MLTRILLFGTDFLILLEPNLYCLIVWLLGFLLWATHKLLAAVQESFFVPVTAFHSPTKLVSRFTTPICFVYDGIIGVAGVAGVPRYMYPGQLSFMEACIHIGYGVLYII